MGTGSEFIEGLVSIVTPVYNGEKYLPRLLNSVLIQTWRHLEMILVDDGSQDATLEIAERYRNIFRARGTDYRIITAPHRNASAAINLGLPYVRGEFLIWPDSDDTLTPDSVRRRAEFLQENPQYQCVRSWMRYLDEENRPMPLWEQLGDPNTEQLFFPLLEGKTFTCCGCYMLRTAALFSIYPERRIPEYEAGQNFQMLLPVLYKWPCPTIREVLFNVYIRKDSHSRQARTYQEERRRYSEFEAMLDELAGIIGIQDPEEKQRIRLWKLRRRRQLALAHGQRFRAAAARASIYRCRNFRSDRLKHGLKKLLRPSS